MRDGLAVCRGVIGRIAPTHAVETPVAVVVGVEDDDVSDHTHFLHRDKEVLVLLPPFRLYQVVSLHM